MMLTKLFGNKVDIVELLVIATLIWWVFGCPVISSVIYLILLIFGIYIYPMFIVVPLALIPHLIFIEEIIVMNMD